VTTGIIGGGIAGLASAIALAKIGRQVEVYEQTSEFSEVGAGLQIGPNAVSALKQLGVFEALEPLTVKPHNIRIFDGLSGKLLTTLPLGQQFENHFGQPYRVAHRADLHSALLNTAKKFDGINLHLNSSLTRLEIEPDNTTCHFANGLNATHQLLVGADGFRSAVRRSVLNDGPPIFAGHTLYRALISMADAPDVAYIKDVNLWLYPNGHVVHYPVSSGNQLNIVAASEQDWENKDWSTAAPPDEVKSYFPNASQGLQQILNAPEGWLKWAAAGHPHATRWHRHNTILIGDAIHPTLPYMAQGAAMALEDAVCLASTLSSTTGTLASFATERQPRTKKIVETSRKMGNIYHMNNPGRWVRNLVIGKISTKAQYKQLSWLYRWSVPKFADQQ